MSQVCCADLPCSRTVHVPVPRQLLESHNLELLYGSKKATLVLLGFYDVQQNNSYSDVSEVPVSGCQDAVGRARTDARQIPINSCSIKGTI